MERCDFEGLFKIKSRAEFATKPEMMASIMMDMRFPKKETVMIRTAAMFSPHALTKSLDGSIDPNTAARMISEDTGLDEQVVAMLLGQMAGMKASPMVGSKAVQVAVPKVQFANVGLKPTKGIRVKDGIVKKYVGTSDVVVVPEIASGQRVKGIGLKAFDGSDIIKKLVLPDTIEAVGELAFCECVELEDAYLGKSLQFIGRCAFFGCKKLEKVHIEKLGGGNGSDEVYICEGAFDQCVSLKEVRIDGRAIIERRAFEQCDSLEKVIVNGEAIVECFRNKNPKSIMKLQEIIECDSLSTTIELRERPRKFDRKDYQITPKFVDTPEFDMRD